MHRPISYRYRRLAAYLVIFRGGSDMIAAYKVWLTAIVCYGHQYLEPMIARHDLKFRAGYVAPKSRRKVVHVQ